MSSSIQKKIGISGIIALLLTNFAYMSDLAIIPAYSAIFKHFADDPPAVTNFIASGSQLTLIVGCLVAPLLMRYISKKNIIVAGVAIFTVVSVCNGLIDDAFYVAVMRGVAGFFMGLIMPCATALLMEIYKDDDKQRTKYLGWFDGSMPGIGCVLLLLSGVLLSFGWQYIFGVFLLGIPVLIFVIIVLPQTPPDRKRAAEPSQADADAKPATAAGKITKINVGKLTALFLSFTLCNMFYGALVYEFSMYLMENFTIPAYMNGVLGAIKGVTGAIMGFFVFAPLFARAKRFTITICFAAQAVAYFGLIIVLPGVPGILWFLLCYSFIGIAFGLSVPYYYSYSSMVFPQNKMTFVTSVISVAFSLGAFLSTYFVTFLQTILHLDAYTPVLPYVGLCCLVAAVLTVIVGMRDPDRRTAFATLQKGGNEDVEATEG